MRDFEATRRKALVGLFRGVCRRIPICCSKALVLCALAGTLVSSTGLYLLPIPVQFQSARYPCESHACGCDSTHCWEECCCFSAQAKLTWAAQQGVTPPRGAGKGADAVAHHDSEPGPDAPSFALLKNANSCRGFSDDKAVVVFATCQSASTAWRPGPPQVVFGQCYDRIADSVTDSPPTPPPRNAT